MLITSVDSFAVFRPGPKPGFSWRKGLPGSPADSHVGILRIGTDAGIDGVAMATWPGSAAVLAGLVDRHLRQLLLGQDPLQRELLWHLIWELDRIAELPLPLFGIADVALWDLAGRAVGMPAWQLIGGFRDKIPAYASTVTFATTAEYLNVASQCLGLGYQAIKVHGWGDARADALLCRRLRAHVGDAVPLMYDGSAGFDLPDAIYLGRALTDEGFLWYEEPMREFSVTAYARLAQAVGVPLLVAETSDGAHMNTADFIASGAATFGVRASTTLRGGFTGALRTAHLADAFRLRAEVHGGGVTSRHLCMAIANTTYYESLITTTEVSRGPEVDADGFVHAPAAPGVGLPAGLDYPAELSTYIESGAEEK